MGYSIVLFEPQIPPNTGNIGRLCVATHSSLHLIEPLGFDISEKAVRRAGLDYWKHIDLHLHKSYAEFRATVPTNSRLWFFTKFATKSLYEAKFSQNDYFIFGKETTGLPEDIKSKEDPDSFLCIPMPNVEVVRSLNLAASAHIAIYEAIRQNS